MKRKLNWQVPLGAALLAASAVLYLAHWLIFGDAHHIWIYLVGDLAFLPIEVLLVTLIIHGVLSAREKRSLLGKLNMVIGAFFSEVGTKLLRDCAAIDRDAGGYGPALAVSADWTQRDFASAHKAVKDCGGSISPTSDDLLRFRSFLIERRGFMLRLLENPNLLEHETFSDLLWAVFHLTDELGQREDLEQASGEDLKHLTGDLRRAYRLMAMEWIDYMRHLKQDYPYLFSLASRTNPFNPRSSAEVS